ncbi:heat stress transcription factor B-2b [Senna tora]|uniref:Heat stress transcription factor B-2b n=1 Tax=Senna tora TaxID=362788 RepID=A0A834SYA6_9FABA|nr:heat stress transcription factor B-2b [Senna tora]
MSSRSGSQVHYHHHHHAAPLESTSGGELAQADSQSQRSIPTPFLTKTYQLVDDPSVDDLISWNEDGTSFVVWKAAEFARDLLPKYFKHNNFSSFGFRKVVPDRWEFANDSFRRGEKGLLRDIQRRKITLPSSTAANAVAVAAVGRAVSPSSNSGDEQVISSNSSPISGNNNTAVLLRTASCSTAAPELLEENERLRKENMQLSQEVSQLKSLCNNILALMTNYASSQLEGVGSSSSSVPEGKPLMELLPVKQGVCEEVVHVPKLFGVSIGIKRCRREALDGIGKDEANHQTQSSSPELPEGDGGGSDMKSEPMDGNQSDGQEPPWLDLGK